MKAGLLSFSILGAAALALLGQNAEQVTPVRLIVTAEGKSVPNIQAGDITIYQGKERERVRDWTALQGGNTGVQLTILIDDGASSDVALQFPELKKFMQQQPASTEIAVAYMRNGVSMMAQTFTADRGTAAKALRVPLGTPGASASPYISLSDLIKHWPESGKAREVVVITNGFDPLYGGPPPLDPYLDTAIHDAQRVGVVVYSIFWGGRGHFSHSYWRINWGENYLSQLSDETGGEAYWQGFSNPVSFAPYLTDLSQKLAHQFLLTFVPKPQAKSGFERVKVTTELKGVELLSADQVYAAGPR